MLNMARKVDATGAIGMEIGLPKEAIEAARQAARDANTAVATRAAQPDAEEAAPLSATRAADGLLVGRELDEASVQTQNMIEQVAAMVEKDPEAIAGLLEQWVRSTG
jgi:flagellar biosynthesis/type III secretory pathway M-ring protein FliF/YscJ